MRLLNAITRQLEEFVAEEEIPRYAILSHTWGKAADEVKLQDLSEPAVKKKIGYLKIDYCCQQALKDGLIWVWVDTCCIDKASTAELSEAINSMFRWYQQSEVCYAYLADVADIALDGFLDEPSEYPSFTNSRWFTRGWTLQEFIAPRKLMFFSRNWHSLGSKRRLHKLLSKITRIPEDSILSDDRYLHLRDHGPSIAQIMSWAAERQTTRIEDKAYCLLGLFDINMPLLYGEGRKAFFRLQEELLKCSHDQSLFAWGVDSSLQDQQDFDPNIVSRLAAIFGGNPDDLVTTGMFARSPKDFRNSGNIHRRSFPLDLDSSDPLRTPAVTINRGIRAEMPLVAAKELVEGFSNLLRHRPELSQLANMAALDRLIFAIIPCTVEGDTQRFLGIPLLRLSPLKCLRAGFPLYGRYEPLLLIPWNPLQSFYEERAVIHVDSHWIADWCAPGRDIDSAKRRVWELKEKRNNKIRLA